MAFWGIAATLYGLVMAGGALTQTFARRHVMFAAALAYSLVAAGAATLVNSFWMNLLMPGALLLTGYWLSGLAFHSPQAWLEGWLLSVDRAARADRWSDHLPRVVAELLEASYAAVYLVVAGGAVIASARGVEAVAYYWNLVLTATLASYAPMPWLRSRPPRVIEATALRAGPYLRRMNLTILDAASVQANTLPSGHVSGAMAAALAVMTIDAGAGWFLVAVALLIAVAATAGRYHYLVDCIAGAIVAAIVFAVM